MPEGPNPPVAAARQPNPQRQPPGSQREELSSLLHFEVEHPRGVRAAHGARPAAEADDGAILQDANGYGEGLRTSFGDERYEACLPEQRSPVQVGERETERKPIGNLVPCFARSIVRTDPDRIGAVRIEQQELIVGAVEMTDDDFYFSRAAVPSIE